jgi:hypothetical protein
MSDAVGRPEVRGRDESNRRRWMLRILTIGIGGVLILGCDRATPNEDRPSSAPAAAMDSLLDPPSRDLLTVIEPEESIEATIQTDNAIAVVATARGRSLAAQNVATDQVVVRGPVRPVLQLVADANPTSVTLADDSRVDRWLPAVRPRVDIPDPGSPYRDRPLVADLTAVAIPDERRAAMVRALAGLLVTIDGAPYARVALSGGCDPRPAMSCAISFLGFTRGAASRADELGVTAGAATLWIPQLVDKGQLGSVPRPLLRAAEWSARHNATAAAAIARFTQCCGARWFLPQPGLIELSYLRRCPNSLEPAGSGVATTGDCRQALHVMVDLRTATIIRIQEPDG